MVKHEALSVRAERERVLAGPAPRCPSTRPRRTGSRSFRARLDGPAERAERDEAVERSREALTTLKPQELRALSLLAEGYSYREIADITGYSATKVNRAIVGGTGALPPLPRPPRRRRPLHRAGAAALGLRRRRGGRGRRRHPARAPAHLRPLPLDPARLPRRPARRGGAPPGPAADPRRPPRPPPRRLRRGGDAGRRWVGRLRLDPRRDRLGGRHARRRDDGARQGAGDLRRDGRRAAACVATGVVPAPLIDQPAHHADAAPRR